jgi:hypothetical protein
MFTPLAKAFRKPLSDDEAPTLWASFGSSMLYSTHGVQWRQRTSHGGNMQAPVKGRRLRLWQTMCYDLNPVAFWLGCFLNTVSGVVVTVGRPMALRYAVREVEHGDLELSNLVGLTALLCGVIVVEGLTMVWGKHLMGDHLGTAFFAFLNGLIVDKQHQLPRPRPILQTLSATTSSGPLKT